jgi:hypothetical protein
VLASIQAALDGIASAGGGRGRRQRWRLTPPGLPRTDVIKQLGLDLEANAEAILERAVDAPRHQGIRRRPGLYRGQPVGSVVVSEQERTDTLVHVRNLLGVVSLDGNSFILDDDTVKYEDGSSIAIAAVGHLAPRWPPIRRRSRRRRRPGIGRQRLASLITTLTADCWGNTAAIVTEQTARADADSAFASSISSLAVSVGNNTSAITSEAAVRASADTSIAATVTALTSTVSGNTASISSRGGDPRQRGQRPLGDGLQPQLHRWHGVVQRHDHGRRARNTQRAGLRQLHH